jgi:hypothetical protein
VDMSTHLEMLHARSEHETLMMEVEAIGGYVFDKDQNLINSMEKG